MAKHTKPYAKDPDDGLTSEEQKEVNTWEESVVKDEADPPVAPAEPAHTSSVASEPYKPPPVPPAPSAKAAAEEIKRLEARIKADQARIYVLEHPYVPFPKWVKGQLFETQEALDAAGPEYS